MNIKINIWMVIITINIIVTIFHTNWHALFGWFTCFIFILIIGYYDERTIKNNNPSR